MVDKAQMVKLTEDDRRVLREAIQSAYPEPDNLKLFIRERLGQSLASIAGSGIPYTTIVFNVIDWAIAEGRIDDLIFSFKEDKPARPDIKQLCDRLLNKPKNLIPKTNNLAQEDWDTLFNHFSLDDFADVIRSFFKGFKEALGIEFQQVRPDKYPVTMLVEIKELMKFYDTNEKGPALAVSFVDAVIVELRRSDDEGTRDLTVLKAWRDRIAQQFQVPPPPKLPEQDTKRYAYLLVTLEEHGDDVIAYPELRITGEEKPIRFGAQPITCPIDQAAQYIQRWIDQAEAVSEVGDCDESQVILEVFLPCKYLVADVVTDWRIQDKRGREKPLLNHRRLLVRSEDRLREPKTLEKLTQRWQRLAACVQAGNAGGQFHRQEVYLEVVGDLGALLDDVEALGLKHIASMPLDEDKRKDLFYDIIDAAIPIALWSFEEKIADVKSLEHEFDALLTGDQLTSFAGLSRGWRRRRIESPNAKSIRLLCDQPDRLPRLPDSEQEADLIVAPL